MVNIIDKIKDTIKNANGTSRATIPERWANMANLEPEANCTTALVNTKHGLAFMVWADNQPRIDDVDENL